LFDGPLDASKDVEIGPPPSIAKDLANEELRVRRYSVPGQERGPIRSADGSSNVRSVSMAVVCGLARYKRLNRADATCEVGVLRIDSGVKDTYLRPLAGPAGCVRPDRLETPSDGALVPGRGSLLADRPGSRTWRK